MLLTIHLLAAAMYGVLLTPLWLFLGLKLAIWVSRLRGGPHGWLADAQAILQGDGGTPSQRQAHRGLPSGETGALRPR